MREKGTVKSFGAKGGYGFIENDDSGEILFFHNTEWKLPIKAQPGLIVEYTPAKTDKGMRATDIQRARRSI